MPLFPRALRRAKRSPDQQPNQSGELTQLKKVCSTLAKVCRFGLNIHKSSFNNLYRDRPTLCHTNDDERQNGQVTMV